MENNKIPESYKEAIASGKIEYATHDGGPSRAGLIQRVNMLYALSEIGIFYRNISGGDVEKLYEQIEQRGIIIPETPFDLMHRIERRHLVDELKKQSESITQMFPPLQKIQHSDKTRYLMQLQQYYRNKKI